MASSRIAALLFTLGKMAHLMFKIPSNADEMSNCLILKKSKLAQLIRKASVVTWDEAPMRYCYMLEALEHFLRDICNRNRLFGWKMSIFGGDFRQVLLIVTRDNRVDIVASSILMESF